MELDSPVVPGENDQIDKNESSKEQNHDILSQNAIQDVVSEVLATVDGQYDTLDDQNEESELQHSTDNDTTEEPPANPLISSDEDVNNLHSSVLYPTTTTDLHSRSSEAELHSDGKIISLDEWDHEPDEGEGEHLYEDSNRTPNIPSIHTDKEQALEDRSQFCKFIIRDSTWIQRVFFLEDVHSEVTEQDEPANSWQDADHGQYQFVF